MAKLQELTLNRGSSRALLIFALIAGLIAAVLVFLALQDSDGSSQEAPAVAATVDVVVAAQSIAPGTEVTEEMLKIVSVPKDLLVSGALTDTTPIVGEVSSVRIAQGEQITDSKIGLAVPDKGLSGVVPPGMRGVAVQVDELTAVGGNLLPGDRVDILASIKVISEPGLDLHGADYVLRTELLLQDVEVISIAQEAQEPAAGQTADAVEGEGAPSYTSGQVPEDVDQQPDANTVTVALTPDQAQLLISRQEYAIRVWATQRAFGDDLTHEGDQVDVFIVGNDNDKKVIIP